MNSYRMDFLLSKGQALEGRKFDMLWSSKDESAYGETGGTIRNLAIRYLKEEMKGEYTPVLQNNWKIIGVDTKSSQFKAVADLVNKGILEVPTTKDGKYTNVASINVNDAVTSDEIKVLTVRAKVSNSQFSKVKTTGELYKQLSQTLNSPESDGNEGKDKPVIPSKTKPEVTKPLVSKGKVTAYSLYVRSHPANNGKIVGAVSKNSEMMILGKEKGWYKVTYKGKTAYVSSKHVKLQK